MKKLAKTFSILGLIGAALFAPFSLAQTHSTYATPDMYVVMFRADWCGPCRIVEPKLKQALVNLRDPKIEYLVIDISHPSTSEIGAHAAFDRQIVPQYNGWLGTTGFAALIDADTKRTLGCINMLYDTGAMQSHIANLKQVALTNRHVQDVTCPELNRTG